MNVNQGALPHIYLADPQLVGIGVLHRLAYLADHDAGEGRRNRAELLDLQPAHGEGVSQLLGRQRGVAKFAQPGLGKLHGVVSCSAVTIEKW